MRLQQTFTLIALCAVPTLLRAQEIMGYEEYQRMEHEEPYILRVCAAEGNGELLYFGSRHSNDPKDSQMDQIARSFDAVLPDLALTEGGDLEVDGLTREEAIRRFGESGLTRRLAHGLGVPAHNLDPAREAEIAHLRDELDFTVPQLKLFYTLRQVSQSHRSQAQIDFDQAVPQYLQHLSTERGLSGSPETLSEFEADVRRLLPQVTNWREISAQYFFPGPQDAHHFTNDIQTASNNFRDRYHVRRILEFVDSGSRVFAIVGSTHVVMQEQAIRKELGGGDCSQP